MYRPREEQSPVDPEVERIRAQARQLAANDPGLQAERRQIADAQAATRKGFEDLQWSKFFASHPDIVDNVANRIPLETYAISISDGRITAANLEEAARHPDISKKLARTTRKPSSKVPTDADRETLDVWCRKNRLLPNDGALRRLCELHGNGFEPYQIDAAVASNEIQLSGGTPEDIARWDREDKIQRAYHLKFEASPSELRAAVRAEGAKTVQQTAQTEFEQRQKVTAQMQKGYPALPAHINRAWLIKKSSAAVGSAEYNEFRNAVKQFGTAQVTALLQQQ